MASAERRTLRGLRADLNLSQHAVAARCGVKSVTVGSWERGENEPGALKATKYADVLGLTMGELNDLLLDAKQRRKRSKDTDKAATS